MDQWTLESAKSAIHDFDKAPRERQTKTIKFLNENYPPSVFADHLERRRRALINARDQREVLNGARQLFPPLMSSEENARDARDLEGCAVVLTAGGEGERLKTSLLARGISESDLKDFTKATWPLPGFFGDYGALQANLRLLSVLAKRHGLTLPVIVTTGPAGSTTARIIPQLLRQHENFGLERVLTVEQDERLHFTLDEKIVLTGPDGAPRPVTHPDETGGPLMKLKKPCVGMDRIVLDWIRKLGCDKILLLQATGLYEPRLLFQMAFGLATFDCVGVGIARTRFEATDPFGTYVTTVKNGRENVVIVEQGIRNEATLQVMDESKTRFLPYNTGLYAFTVDLLEKGDLPDYATPPKEVLRFLPRSPKIGYAATDLFTLAKKPGVLSIPRDWFEVIKNADDLQKLADLGRRFGIDKMCEGAR